MSSTADNPNLYHLAFEVFGKVQKVFFRANTESEANKLGLIGHVENTVEGSVKGEAIGTKENIQQFQHWLRHVGSPQSKIEDAKFTLKQIDATEKDAYNFTKFEIKRFKKVQPQQ